MTHNKGLGILAILVVTGAIALGAVGYYVVKPQMAQAPTQEVDDGVQTEQGDHMEVDHEANEGVNTSVNTTVSWKFSPAAEANGIPQTKVDVTVNDKAYAIGTFAGSCSEVDASGGIDGKGLLAGELSAAQCWFAGGGDEIGVFAHEDGGYQIMVGELGEPVPEENSSGFRGNFKIKTDISL